MYFMNMIHYKSEHDILLLWSNWSLIELVCVILAIVSLNFSHGPHCNVIVDEFSSDEEDKLPDLIELDLAELVIPPPSSELSLLIALSAF